MTWKTTGMTRSSIFGHRARHNPIHCSRILPPPTTTKSNQAPANPPSPSADPTDRSVCSLLFSWARGRCLLMLATDYPKPHARLFATWPVSR